MAPPKKARPQRASRKKATAGRPVRSPGDATRRVGRRAAPPAPPASEEALQGPPPREATMMRSDAERREEAQLRQYTSTSPQLTGGDVQADWERAASVGEEAVGGTVATPDQDVVDELGGALGVPRAPEEEFRTSEEILERRDRHRWEQEG